MLEVRDLNAFYGQAQILFDVQLSVAPGQVLALMGRNGAGKSTTIKSIMGLIDKRQGTIIWNNQSIGQLPSHEIARLGLGYVPEDRRVFSELTVVENLEVGRKAGIQSSQIAPWTIDALFELFPNLAAMPNRLGSQMSGGEQQMLSVARTLMGNPSLVLLDEPSEGVAPVIVEQMARAILTMKQQGVSILLSEQNFNFAQQVCDHAVILEKGQVRFNGSFSSLQADPSIVSQWLGF
jgi:branched-chain amino acid transport system ATP-binding protein